MASLFPDPLLEVSGLAPPPDNTFYHFSVTKSEVIWRWWTISPRAVYRNTRPGETKLSHLELLENPKLQSDISMVFGCHILERAKSLCQGHLNYLENAPDSLLLRIMAFLELEDVGQLLRTSRRFWKLCQSETFWKSAVQQRCSTLSGEVECLAFDIGWRRIFFTNKIQLQLLINRWIRKRDALVETSDDQNDPSELPLVNESPDSTDKKSQSSTGSSGIKRGESPLLSLSSDDSLPNSPSSHLIFNSEEDLGNSVTKETTEDLENTTVSLSQGISQTAQLTSTLEEEPGSTKINELLENLNQPILSLSTENCDRRISPLSNFTSSSEEDPEFLEFSDKFKKFRLSRGRDPEKESDDSLPSISQSSDPILSSEEEPGNLVIKDSTEDLENSTVSLSTEDDNPTIRPRVKPPSSTKKEPGSSKINEFFKNISLPILTLSTEDHTRTISPPVKPPSSLEDEPGSYKIRKFFENVSLPILSPRISPSSDSTSCSDKDDKFWEFYDDLIKLPRAQHMGRKEESEDSLSQPENVDN